MKTTYNADYFIKKFEAIPEEAWCTGKLAISKNVRCALGHCGVPLVGSWPVEAIKLWDLMCATGDVSSINDGKESDYPQPTPKQRILAALRDIKAKEAADA